MSKKLYRVYLTRFQGFHETGLGNSTLSLVVGLGLKKQYFKTVGTPGNVYWSVFLHQAREIPVYCHEENLSMSHDEIIESVWEYDEKKDHIILVYRVVVPPDEPPPVKQEIEIVPPRDAPTEEEFQEDLKSLRPYSRSFLQRNREYNLTKEDKKLLKKTNDYFTSFASLPAEEQHRRRRLVNDILFFNDELIAFETAKIEQPDKEEETETNTNGRKRWPLVFCVLLMFACLLAFLFFGIDFGGNRTAKITTTVTPTQSPSKQGILPTLNPVTSPTSIPTEENITLSPTSIPTEQTIASSRPTGKPTITPIGDTSSQTPTEAPILLPTLMPTFFLSGNPTAQPTSLINSVPTFTPSTNPTISPSKNPTMSPTQIPTNNPTNSPSTKPTIQPISLNTASPTFSPSAHPSFAPTLHPTLSPSKVATLSPVSLPNASPTVAPSHLPTTGTPTLFPTVQQTEFPTFSPTKPPSLQIKSRLTCNEIRETKAATEGNFGDNNFKIEIIDGKEYCGDTYGGVDPERPNRNKWSVRNGRRDCPTFSYEDGSDVCDTVGARWCSLEELELLVGKGTGCGGDKLLIYSSTECESETGFKGKMKYAPGSQAVRFPKYECEVDLSSETLVRCCGDY